MLKKQELVEQEQDAVSSVVRFSGVDGSLPKIPKDESQIKKTIEQVQVRVATSNRPPPSNTQAEQKSSETQRYRLTPKLTIPKSYPFYKFAKKVNQGIKNFLIRPFKEDKDIAIAYTYSCLLSTASTTLLTLLLGAQTREAIGLTNSTTDHAAFAGLTQIFSYGIFCAAYYPSMMRLKLRELKNQKETIQLGDYLKVVTQCGVDFGIHLFLIDTPCHALGGSIQTGLTVFAQSFGIMSLKFIDTITTATSQILADIIFTPLEAHIWRWSAKIAHGTFGFIHSALPKRLSDWLESTVIHAIDEQQDR